MKILFICTGNTCRSPMAEGIFNYKFAGNGAICKSAGLSAVNGIPPSENAVKACLEIGIDISSYRSTNIEAVNQDEFDYFVVMTSSHAQSLKLLSIPGEKIYILGNGIDDPFGFPYDQYVKCRDEIYNAITKFVLEKQI